jgi:hypothetical protein
MKRIWDGFEFEIETATISEKETKITCLTRSVSPEAADIIVFNRVKFEVEWSSPENGGRRLDGISIKR